MRPVATLAAGTTLLGLLFAAYWPAVHGPFVFDDHALLTINPLVAAGDGLSRIWFTTEPIDYWPMTNSAFWLEWRLWGSMPTGYHVTNLVLHFLSSLLLWAILRQLDIRGAFLGASLFCLHPVNVQSVAWIAQLKNTLSMLFFLLSAYWFLASEVIPGDSGTCRTRRTCRTWFSIAAFVLAMLSKGSVAVLPGVLLLLGWWRDGSLSRRLVLRVLPFAVIAVGLTFVNIWFQHRMAGSIRDLSPVERLLGAGAAVWFYLSKALLPVNLAFVYPQWTIDASDVRWWLPLAGVAAIIAALFVSRRRDLPRALLFAWAFFLVALVPVMGFTDVYFMKYSAVADHYQYIAVITVVTVIAAAVGSLKRPAVVAALGGALVTAYAVLTWQQSHLYAEPEHFYRASLAANPSSWVLRNNLGVLLIDRGKHDEAITHLREALRANPNVADAYQNLCLATAWMNRFAEALDDCASATRMNPSFADGHKNLGVALMSFGRFAEAQPELESAISLRADDAETHYYLGHLFLATRQPAAALRQYNEMARLVPRSAAAQNGAGMAERDLGNIAEAERRFRAALALQPDFREARQNLDALLKR